jgi:hypothetical protein
MNIIIGDGAIYKYNVACVLKGLNIPLDIQIYLIKKTNIDNENIGLLTHCLCYRIFGLLSPIDYKNLHTMAYCFLNLFEYHVNNLNDFFETIRERKECSLFADCYDDDETVLYEENIIYISEEEEEEEYKKKLYINEYYKDLFYNRFYNACLYFKNYSFVSNEKELEIINILMEVLD